MPLRPPAGFIRPGYDPLKVPNAPTIGTASSASGTSVSVAFTAPTNVGGSAITGYVAVATDSSSGVQFNGTGSSSPITISGLTTGNTYTCKVFAINSYGPSVYSGNSGSVVPVAMGQQAFTTAGTYTWVAPAGVTSASIVTVGGGGGGRNLPFGGAQDGGGGAGGALAYANNVSITPGSSYTVVVGVGGTGGDSPGTGGQSRFSLGGTTYVAANGGTAGQLGPNAAGGTVSVGTGGAGGIGTGGTGAGGGGAGGYAGAGGQSGYAASGSAGAGGGGGGGGSAGSFSDGIDQYRRGGSGGGGVGILGQGSDGTAGSGNNSGSPSTGGGGGSGGAAGDSVSGSQAGAAGGAYGGGGGGGGYIFSMQTFSIVFYGSSGNGAVGAVRIIWPGSTRSFPSTNTGNL